MRLRALVVAVLVLVLGAWTCAPTGSGVGDVPISTTGLTALVEGEDWHYVGETDEPAFQNSWANISANPKMAFRIREAGIVDIHGVIVGGASGAVIFTLPEGYRPSSAAASPVYADAGGGPIVASVNVTTAGAVSASFGTPGAVVLISGQFFLAMPDVAP